MVDILTGLAGGLIATIVMTIFMMLLGDDSPPPTSLFWSKYIGAEGPEEYLPQGMALHGIYGIVAGGVFAVVVPFIEFVSVETIEVAVLWGLVYGVVLFIGGAVFWMRIVLDIEPDKRMIGMFLLFHLIYGAVYGLSIGLDIV